MHAHRVSCRKKTIPQIHQTGFYVEVPEDECVWFNLLLKPKTLEHLLEIPKENRIMKGQSKLHHQSLYDGLWWKTWQHGEQAYIRWSPEPRTPAGGPQPQAWAWNIRTSIPTTSPSIQELKLLNGWESITLMTMRDDLEQRAWKEQTVLVWSPTRAHPHEMWESMALFCTTHTHKEHTQRTQQHTHSIQMEHTHTHHTHKQNIF